MGHPAPSQGSTLPDAALPASRPGIALARSPGETEAEEEALKCEEGGIPASGESTAFRQG